MPQTPRFYVDAPLATGVIVDLPEQVAHHALRVLRLENGAAVTVFNGQGGEFHGALSVSASGRQASFEPREWQARDAELGYDVMVGQGICAGDKMDWLIEKCVELGVAQVRPLSLEKCVTRLAPERADKRVAHWQQLVKAASEQCGRNRLMQLERPTPLDAFIAAARDSTYRLVLSPDANQSLAEFAASHAAAAASLLIGPEAGLAPDEFERALHAGFTPISLGPRILRTETAALATLAGLNALWALHST